MKSTTIKNTLRASLLAGILFTTGSCEKYLERTPESIVSEEVAFRNFINFQGYTEEMYQCIVNITAAQNADFNWGEDQVPSTSFESWNLGHSIERGNFWAWQAQHSAGNMFDRVGANTDNNAGSKALWPLAWYAIRKANIGLENLHQLTSATEEERRLIEGQLLFFRGYFHFSLIQYFGGLPYIDKVLPGDEPLREPRLSYHECADKAAADFRRAADLLPINWESTVAGANTSGKNQYRINKIMALGYLGKNLLYAGSPLMNFESTGSRSYNTEYCKRAASAFGELLNLVESGQTQYKLQEWAKYREIFVTRGQNFGLPGGTEAIFRSLYWAANGSNWPGMKQYVPMDVGENAGFMFAPSANYVNLYSMSNGLPLPEDISQPDPESGWDPHFPWKDRDPRFYQNFYYDGVRFIQGNPPNPELRYAPLYSGGLFRTERTASRTGYLMRKFPFDGYNKVDLEWRYANSPHWMIPLLRLADVYLMYAESALIGYNSVSGKSENFNKTALEAVNEIRQRATMAPVHSKFTSDVNLFLQEVRRERAVELSYEGHRFNDLRRWLLLTESKYMRKTKIEFDRAGTFSTTSPETNEVVNLREETVTQRSYTDKHYWFPLKVSDVTLYPEFYQNPGW